MSGSSTSTEGAVAIKVKALVSELDVHTAGEGIKRDLQSASVFASRCNLRKANPHPPRGAVFLELVETNARRVGCWMSPFQYSSLMWGRPPQD